MALPTTAVDADPPRSPRTAPHCTPTSVSLLTHKGKGLADLDLLAALLEPGLGPVRAREGAARLLHGFPAEDGRRPLRRLGRAAPSELVKVGSITPAAAARVVAALELGRRFAMEPVDDRCRFRTARDVYERFYPRLRDLAQEEFWVLVLNRQHELVREVMVARGTLSEVRVEPADVLRPAIQAGGSPIVVVHNHPSGESTPSPADRALTGRLADAASLLGLELWDHVIIGERRYTSFREERLMPGLFL